MYLPNPSRREGWDTKLIFKWSLTGLNSEFFFSLPYYFLSNVGRKLDAYYFPKDLAPCEI